MSTIYDQVDHAAKYSAALTLVLMHLRHMNSICPVNEKFTDLIETSLHNSNAIFNMVRELEQMLQSVDVLEGKENNAAVVRELEQSLEYECDCESCRKNEAQE